MEGKLLSEDHYTTFRKHSIHIQRESEAADWYIWVTHPNGCRSYDGYWRDSAFKTREEAIHEAKRGACLIKEKIMTGAELIAAERGRQKSVEGWTSEHDDEHTQGQLARAAKVYIQAALDAEESRKREVYAGWPWEYQWLKVSLEPVDNLKKAGALIAAEIDRLQRIRESQ